MYESETEIMWLKKWFLIKQTGPLSDWIKSPYDRKTDNALNHLRKICDVINIQYYDDEMISNTQIFKCPYELFAPSSATVQINLMVVTKLTKINKRVIDWGFISFVVNGCMAI